MARATPVHTGYTVINGSGLGSNSSRIDVWIEYKIGTADTANNRTWLDAYFYAALNPNYTSSTAGATGLSSDFYADGYRGTRVEDGSYSFQSTDKINFLGSFSDYIYHDDDGTKALLLEGSFSTPSSYIAGGRVMETITLPAIARAAQVSAGAVTLGGSCRIAWDAISGFRYAARFDLGDWKGYTGYITPDAAGSYTYTGLTLPLELAKKFSGKTATVTVWLTTYQADQTLGQTSTSFTVTVPDNAQTRPVVSAVLSPVCSAFPGSYVQTIGKVSAQIAATDPLGAEITGYTISAGGQAVSGTLSAYLEKSGQVQVTVTATNSRGFTGSQTQTVTVLAYAPPRLLDASAVRCLSDGTYDAGGTFLKITAAWQASPVTGGNTAALWWRYCSEGGQWSSWEKLSGTEYTEMVLSGIVLEKTQAYTVELQAADTAGGSSTASFSIPIEQVYLHRTRNALGVGGYAQESGIVDVHWPVRARSGVNGLYGDSIRVSGKNVFAIQSKYTNFLEGAGNRQSMLLFGYDNGLLVRGILGVGSDGKLKWDGTSGITFTANSAKGTVTVQLPYTAYDMFSCISAEPVDLISAT